MPSSTAAATMTSLSRLEVSPSAVSARCRSGRTRRLGGLDCRTCLAVSQSSAVPIPLQQPQQQQWLNSSAQTSDARTRRQLQQQQQQRRWRKQQQQFALSQLSDQCSRFSASAVAAAAAAAAIALTAEVGASRHEDGDDGELRLPSAWTQSDVIEQKCEWLRTSLQQWLDDEFCPEPPNVEISARCSRVLRSCLLDKETEAGYVLMEMVEELQKMSFKESFHGPFSAANAAIKLLLDLAQEEAGEEHSAQSL